MKSIFWSNTDTFEDKKERLKGIIKKRGIIFSHESPIISPEGWRQEWLFDMRRVLLMPEALNLATDIFWERFEKEYPFQVGGQEIAAVPLITAIALKGAKLRKPVNAFIIRKSRKPVGLQKIIEGELNNEKVILVDDLINYGQNKQHQLAVLEEYNKRVSYVFTLVNFRDAASYHFLRDRKITLVSLFSLQDFGLILEENNFRGTTPDKFEIVWKFKCPNPNLFYVLPKSSPCLDNERIYFGSDSGIFWALSQKDGSVIWKFITKPNRQGKGIFSSPALLDDTVFFGAYDGNVYALDTATGQPKWVFGEADWIGSSPALAKEENLLFMGLEYGRPQKNGGVVALDFKTGEKRWEYFMSEYVHCSPVYCREKDVVAVGGNDSCVYLFDAKTGRLKWKFETDGEVKASLAFSSQRNLLFFGSFDHQLYALDIDTGEASFKIKTGDRIYSTPLILNDTLYFTSLDKMLYALDLKDKAPKWKFLTNGRVFSSPALIDGRIVFGSNDGAMYEIDAYTGILIGFFQAAERITNKIVYNPDSKRYFLTTYANEVFCLKKAEQSKN